MAQKIVPDEIVRNSMKSALYNELRDPALKAEAPFSIVAIVEKMKRWASRGGISLTEDDEIVRAVELVARECSNNDILCEFKQMRNDLMNLGASLILAINLYTNNLRKQLVGDIGIG